MCCVVCYMYRLTTYFVLHDLFKLLPVGRKKNLPHFPTAKLYRVFNANILAGKCHKPYMVTALCV